MASAISAGHRAADWARGQTRELVAQQRGPRAAWRITDRRGRLLAAIAIPIALVELIALIFQVSAVLVGAMHPSPSFGEATGRPAWLWVALISFQALFTAAVTTGIGAGVVMGAARHYGDDPTIAQTYRALAARWRLLLGATGLMWAIEVLMGCMWLFAYRTKPGISPWWLAVGVVIAVAVPLTAAGHVVWPRALLTGSSYRQVRADLSSRGLRKTYTSGVGVLLSSPAGFFPMWLAVAWFVGGLSVGTIPTGYQPLGDILVTAIIVVAVGFVARYLTLTALTATDPPRPHPGSADTRVESKVGVLPQFRSTGWWAVVIAGIAVPALILRLALWWLVQGS